MENTTKALSQEEINLHIQHAKSIRSETMIGHFVQLSDALHGLFEQVSVKLHGMFSGKSGLKKV